jgi:hypothetical protein
MGIDCGRGVTKRTRGCRLCRWKSCRQMGRAQAQKGENGVFHTVQLHLDRFKKAITWYLGGQK